MFKLNDIVLYDKEEVVIVGSPDNYKENFYIVVNDNYAGVILHKDVADRNNIDSKYIGKKYLYIQKSSLKVINRKKIRNHCNVCWND